MTALVVTDDFLAWCFEHGYSARDLQSPPVAWGLITLYEKSRASALSDVGEAEVLKRKTPSSVVPPGEQA